MHIETYIFYTLTIHLAFKNIWCETTWFTYDNLINKVFWGILIDQVPLIFWSTRFLWCFYWPVSLVFWFTRSIWYNDGPGPSGILIYQASLVFLLNRFFCFFLLSRLIWNFIIHQSLSIKAHCNNYETLTSGETIIGLQITKAQTYMLNSNYQLHYKFF